MKRRSHPWTSKEISAVDFFFFFYSECIDLFVEQRGANVNSFLGLPSSQSILSKQFRVYIYIYKVFLHEVLLESIMITWDTAGPQVGEKDRFWKQSYFLLKEQILD